MDNQEYSQKGIQPMTASGILGPVQKLMGKTSDRTSLPD